MDLDKINAQFDFKNVDMSQFGKGMTEHQNTFIKLILVVGSLVLVALMFNDHHVKDRNLHIQMSKVQEKMEAVSERDVAQKALNDFKSSVPKRLNETEVITLISNYAKLFQVDILSLSPADSKDMGMFDVVKINFNAQSQDFRAMMIFLRKIEKSDFPLRIDSWSGREDRDGRVTFVIEVSAVFIHT